MSFIGISYFTFTLISLESCLIQSVLLKEISHPFLQKSLVNTHKLGDKCLQMVDGLVPLVNSVLIMGRHVCHLCLQTAVTVGYQFRYQTLEN